MIKYEASVLNQFDSEASGNAFVGVSVTVRKSQTGEKATLYSDNGITEIENPTITNSLGDYSFYISQGEYSIILDEGGEFQKKLEKVFIGSGSGLTVNTESELLKSSNPIGDKISLSESGNPSYIVMPPTTDMLAGDKKADNGNVLSLQPNDDGSFDVRWFGADSSNNQQSQFFDLAAERALSYAQESLGLNSRGVVRVPAGNWTLNSATTKEAVWLLDNGAEFNGPANYAGNNFDNISYLTGSVVKYNARGFNRMHMGSTDLQWLQDVRDSILGTATLQVVSPTGRPGILVGSKTSDKAADSEGTIGFKSYVLNDDESDIGVAYGGYMEAIRAPNAGTTLALETNVSGYGTMTPITPNMDIGNQAKVTANLWVGGPVASGPYDDTDSKVMTSAAMVVTPGGAEEVPGTRLGFDAGIIFLNRSFETSPEKEIIRSFPESKIAWYGVGGTRTSYIAGYTENGEGVLRQRVRRSSDAQLITVAFSPTSYSPTDNSVDLGTASRRWREVFSVNGTINTSDEREKQQARDLSEVEKTVALEIKAMIKGFKWNHAVDEKGDGARWHFGVMAQQVAQAFTDNGLDPESYGMFCYDEWQEDEDAGITAGNRYGVRYNELIMFILGAL